MLLILNFGIGWSRVVKMHAPAALPWRKNHHCPLESTVDGTQSSSQRLEESQILLPLLTFEPRTARHVACRYTYRALLASRHTQIIILIKTVFFFFCALYLFCYLLLRADFPVERKQEGAQIPLRNYTKLSQQP